ncbi:MAG: hypothetical protein WDZ80_04360 [Candidatus Paceibacterota bacterium]
MQSYIDSTKLLELLFEELKIANKRVESSNEKIDRRFYFRIAFSTIEASLSLIRKLLLEFHSNNEIKLKPAQLVLLNEKIFDVKDNGEIYEKPFFISFKRNIKFTFRLCTDVLNLNFKVDYKEPGWQDLVKSNSLRNDITHPRKIDDLEISETQTSTLTNGIMWYMNNHQNLFDEIQKKMNQQTIEIKNEIEKLK